MRYFIIYFSFCQLLVGAQEHKQSSFFIDYNHQMPLDNLANIFGDNSLVGLTFIKQSESNIFYGININYLFGDNVNDNAIFQNIQTENGGILAADGTYANINLMQRGFDGYLLAGYSYNFDIMNLSGIYFSAGIGFLQYKIFIDTDNQNIPQLNEDMKKGYDQLHNGISSKWEISYKHYSLKNNFHYSVGFNLTAAYTKNIRPYSFNTMQYNNDNMKWDKLFGLSAGVIIPINRKNNEEFHYY